MEYEVGDYVNFHYSKVQTYPAKVLKLLGNNNVLIRFMVEGIDGGNSEFEDLVRRDKLTPRVPIM